LTLGLYVKYITVWAIVLWSYRGISHVVDLCFFTKFTIGLALLFLVLAVLMAKFFKPEAPKDLGVPTAPATNSVPAPPAQTPTPEPAGQN